MSGPRRLHVASFLATILLFGASSVLVAKSQTEDPAAAGASESTPPPADEPTVISAPYVELRALDKVTARVKTLYAPIGEVVRFGTLEITAAVCFKRPPEEPPESAAFLSIADLRADTPPIEVFSGWMFASSPGLSALEHPVYDVWILDCLSKLPSDAARSSGGGSP